MYNHIGWHVKLVNWPYIRKQTRELWFQERQKGHIELLDCMLIGVSSTILSHCYQILQIILNTSSQQM